MSNTGIVVASRDFREGTTAVPVSDIVIETNIITNTTTVERDLEEVITSVDLVPYMRGLPIEFAAYKLRPSRHSWLYFDNEPVSKFVQRPNVLEIDKRYALKGLGDGFRDTIRVNGANAKILHAETNEVTGNTRFYLVDWDNPAAITTGAAVTSTSNGSFTADVISFVHYSGKIDNSSNTTHIVFDLSADSVTNNVYTGNTLTIVSGPNAGESREIIDYDATSRTAVVSPEFTTMVANSIYSIGDSRVSWSSNTTQSFYTTSRGVISGILHIPDPTQNSVKFRTGERIFRILDNPRNDPYLVTSLAEYRFVSNGLNLTQAQLVQRTTYNTNEERINIYLPATPTPTPSVSRSATPTPTPTPSGTATPTPSVTVTPSVTPSITVSPSVTPSPTGSLPPISVSATPSPTPAVSGTPTPTSSPPPITVTPSPTSTPSSSPPPTRTPTPTPTSFGACDPAGPWTFATFTEQAFDNGGSEGAPRKNWQIIGTLTTIENTTLGVICSSNITQYNDPIAQSFFVSATDYPSGAFISSVDLFFKNKGDQLPVQVQIRPVVNGFPSANEVIPGAVSILEPEDIKVSDIPSVSNTATKTTFTFPSPVYLNSGFEYAVVVMSDDFGYDYYLAEKGGQVIGGTTLIGQQPSLGSLFKSQNGRTWTAYQNDDLMFVLNRCQFTVTNGSVYFNEDKNKIASVASGNTVYDSHEIQSDAIEIPGTKLNYKFKSTSNTTGAFSDSYVDIRPDKRFDNEERKVVLYTDNPVTSFETRVDLSTTNRTVSPILYHNRQQLIAIENIINSTSLSDDIVKIVNKGSSYTTNASVTFSSNTGYGANAWAVPSVTGEIETIVFDSYGTGYVDDVTATISGGGGSGATLQVVSETDSSGGPALVRYISKTVTLLDGFDAGDLRVYLTAVKPPESNVQVYYKVRNSLDPEIIDERGWSRMVQKTGAFTYSVNREPLEFEFTPSLTSNNITYTTGSTTYKTFNQFAIKIVLSSTDTVASKIPYVYDLRAIALPEDAF